MPSYETALKQTLQGYLATKTTYSWDQLIADNTPHGFIEIYRIEARDREKVKVYNSFVKNIDYSIQFKVSLLGTDPDTVDNNLMDYAALIRKFLNELSATGTAMNHPENYNPTVLKGIQFMLSEKKLEQMNTGNQSQLNDQLWLGEIGLFYRYRA